MVQIRSGEGLRLRRRREILAAASEVFRSKGLQAAGMRDIAAVLGIAVGKLYYWFESKQDLLAFCQRDTLGRLLRMVQEVRGLGLEADQSLYLLVRGHVRCLNHGTPGSLAHLEVESLAEPHRQGILQLRQRYERCVREVLARGVSDGVFRAVDARLASLSLLGAVNWTVRWFRPGGRTPLDQIEHAFAMLQVRALLAPGRDFTTPEAELVPVTDVGEPS